MEFETSCEAFERELMENYLCVCYIDIYIYIYIYIYTPHWLSVYFN